MKTHWITLAALMAAVAITGCSSTNDSGGGTAPAPVTPNTTLEAEADAAIATFKARDPGLQSWFDDAAGWVMFPNVGKGGFIVGVAHGNGVVYDKNGVKIGQADLTQGTVGLQAGGQAYSELVFFENDGAFAHFKNDNWEVAAQVSAVAVTAGASADARYRNGVAIFTMAQGGFMLEASVGGQRFAYKPY
jgi:lipid-binding SYLF domain-containing protein